MIRSLVLFFSLASTPAFALSYACNSVEIDGDYHGDIKLIVDPDLALVTKVGFGDIQNILTEEEIYSFAGEDLLFSRKIDCVQDTSSGIGDARFHRIQCRTSSELEAKFELSMNEGRSSGKYDGLVFNDLGNLYRFHVAFDQCRKVVP